MKVRAKFGKPSAAVNTPSTGASTSAYTTTATTASHTTTTNECIFVRNIKFAEKQGKTY